MTFLSLFDFEMPFLNMPALAGPLDHFFLCMISNGVWFYLIFKMAVNWLSLVSSWVLNVGLILSCLGRWCQRFRPRAVDLRRPGRRRVWRRSSAYQKSPRNLWLHSSSLLRRWIPASWSSFPHWKFQVRLLCSSSAHLFVNVVISFCRDRTFGWPEVERVGPR